MKKTFTILTLLFSLFLFSQEIKLEKDGEKVKKGKNISRNDSNIFSEVDATAEFPGGIDAFRKEVTNNFKGSNMQGVEGIVKTEIIFLVEKDGSITDVKASGKNSGFNSGVIRAVMSTKTKWSPAKINSIPVRSFFRFQFALNFE